MMSSVMYLVNPRIPSQNNILTQLREVFDVAPFVNGRYKTPVEEIQAAVDGSISTEQAIKLRQRLDHIDEFRKAS